MTSAKFPGFLMPSFPLSKFVQYRVRDTLQFSITPSFLGHHTGISSEMRTKLRGLAVWQARAGCYSQAALYSNDSKTLYARYRRGQSLTSLI